jgi:hypothetical protein
VRGWRKLRGTSRPLAVHLARPNAPWRHRMYRDLVRRPSRGALSLLGGDGVWGDVHLWRVLDHRDLGLVETLLGTKNRDTRTTGAVELLIRRQMAAGTVEAQ